MMIIVDIANTVMMTIINTEINKVEGNSVDLHLCT